MTKTKNPWIASTLNLLLFGAGYMYNGKRVISGLLITIAMAVVRYGEVKIKMENLAPNYWPYLIGGLALAQIALAIDAYNEANEINSK